MSDGAHLHANLVDELAAMRGTVERLAARVAEVESAMAQARARAADLERRLAPALAGAATGWQPSWAAAIEAWERLARPMRVERIYHGSIPANYAQTKMERARGRHVWFSYKPPTATRPDVDRTAKLVQACLAAGRGPDALTVTICHEPVDDMSGSAFRERFDAHARPWSAAGFDVVPVFTNWSIVRPEHDALRTYWPERASGVGVDHYYDDGTGNDPATALAAVTAFARDRGMRLHVGEFGVPARVPDGTAAAWIDRVRVWALLTRPRLLCYWNVDSGGADTRLDTRPQAVAAYQRLWDALS